MLYHWYYSIDFLLSITVVAVFVAFLFSWEYWWIILCFSAIPLIILPALMLFCCDPVEIKEEANNEAHFQGSLFLYFVSPFAFFTLFIFLYAWWPFLFLLPILFWPFAWRRVYYAEPKSTRGAVATKYEDRLEIAPLRF